MMRVWFCTTCEARTEVDVDREQPLCVRCRRPTLRVCRVAGPADPPYRPVDARALFTRMHETVEAAR